GESELPRNGPNVVVCDNCITMNNRPPVRLLSAVRDKFADAGQRFRRALMPKPGVLRINDAKKFDAPERYRAAHLTRQADRPIHRMPDEAAREDQPLRVE